MHEDLHEDTDLWGQQWGCLWGHRFARGRARRPRGVNTRGHLRGHPDMGTPMGGTMVFTRACKGAQGGGHKGTPMGGHCDLHGHKDTGAHVGTAMVTLRFARGHGRVRTPQFARPRGHTWGHTHTHTHTHTHGCSGGDIWARICTACTRTCTGTRAWGGATMGTRRFARPRGHGGAHTHTGTPPFARGPLHLHEDPSICTGTPPFARGPPHGPKDTGTHAGPRATRGGDYATFPPPSPHPQRRTALCTPVARPSHGPLHHRASPCERLARPTPE